MTQGRNKIILVGRVFMFLDGGVALSGGGQIFLQTKHQLLAGVLFKLVDLLIIDYYTLPG